MSLTCSLVWTRSSLDDPSAVDMTSSIARPPHLQLPRRDSTLGRSPERFSLARRTEPSPSPDSQDWSPEGSVCLLPESWENPSAVDMTSSIARPPHLQLPRRDSTLGRSPERFSLARRTEPSPSPDSQDWSPEGSVCLLPESWENPSAVDMTSSIARPPHLQLPRRDSTLGRSPERFSLARRTEPSPSPDSQDWSPEGSVCLLPESWENPSAVDMTSSIARPPHLQLPRRDSTLGRSPERFSLARRTEPSPSPDSQDWSPEGSVCLLPESWENPSAVDMTSSIARPPHLQLPRRDSTLDPSTVDMMFASIERSFARPPHLQLPRRDSTLDPSAVDMTFASIARSIARPPHLQLPRRDSTLGEEILLVGWE
ncbi:uncharacterized protein ACNLHF_024287 [Anomaloglossus baeobatrachus]